MNSVCYLLVWLEQHGDELVATSAGFYSESPNRISHQLNKTIPATVLHATAPTYAEARKHAIDAWRNMVKYASEGHVYHKFDAILIRSQVGVYD